MWIVMRRLAANQVLRKISHPNIASKLHLRWTWTARTDVNAIGFHCLGAFPRPQEEYRSLLPSVGVTSSVFTENVGRLECEPPWGTVLAEICRNSSVRPGARQQSMEIQKRGPRDSGRQKERSEERQRSYSYDYIVKRVYISYLYNCYIQCFEFCRCVCNMFRTFVNTQSVMPLPSQLFCMSYSWGLGKAESKRRQFSAWNSYVDNLCVEVA